MKARASRWRHARWGVLLVWLFAFGCGQRPETHRLAILGFVAPEADRSLAGQGAFLVDLLTARLSTNAGLELVERSDIDALLAEQSLSLAQATGLRESIQAGRLLRADWLVMGSVVTNLTNRILLVKLVDARSSVIRNISLLPVGERGLGPLAVPLASFVLESLQAKPGVRTRTYLAVGNFENVSLIQRYRDFGAKLRVDLTSRFAPGEVTVVERDMIRPLLDELRLSATGFSGEENRPDQAQPAFVLVDGIFQAFQDEESKLNLIMRVERLGDKVERFAFNEPVGDALTAKIVGALEKTMRGPPRKRVSRFEESRAQLERGKERARIKRFPNGRFHLMLEIPAAAAFGETRKDVLEEGIKAFESALFLDPANSEAMLCVSLCYLKPEIDRRAEAISYLQELSSGSTNRMLVVQAREQLAAIYRTNNPALARELYQALWDEAQSAAEKALYAGPLAELSEGEPERDSIPNEDRIQRAFAVWRLRIEEELGSQKTRGTQMLDLSNLLGQEMRGLASAFGEDKAAMKAAFDKVTAELEAAHPELKPFLIAGYVRLFGSNIPSDVREKYVQSLDWCEAHPDQIPFPEGYFGKSLYRQISHHFSITNHDLFLRAVELMNRHGRVHLSEEESDWVSFYEGWVHRQRRDWGRAVAAFERIGPREVSASSSGPWGPFGHYSGKLLAEECRRFREGQALTPRGPPTKMLPGPELSFDSTHLFACDGPRLWILRGNVLQSYSDGRLQTLSVTLSNRPVRRLCTLAVGEKHLWLGTQGEGLLAMDKETGQCRAYTMEQGLLQNHVDLIYAMPDKVWIGFGNREVRFSPGGLGYLDLVRDRFIGVMGELDTNLTERPLSGALSRRLVSKDAPTRSMIKAFAQADPDHILAVVIPGVFRVEPQTRVWESVSTTPVFLSFSANERFMVATTMLTDLTPKDDENVFGPVSFHDRATGRWAGLARADGFPQAEVRAVLVDGNHGWVGGLGFVARVSLERGIVEKVYLLADQAFEVKAFGLNGDMLWLSAGARRSAVGGGYLMQGDAESRLYRLSLREP